MADETFEIGKLLIEAEKTRKKILELIALEDKERAGYLIDLAIFNLLNLQTKFAELKVDMEEVCRLSNGRIEISIDSYDELQAKISKRLRDYHHYQSLGFTNAPED